jgi:UDP-3-O-[3-hydroxymyristoyl] glucosamine N-acyltransferase
MNITLQQLAHELQCEFRGDANTLIRSVASPSSAQPGDLCFALREKNLVEIIDSDCSAVIVPLGLAAEVSGKNLLISENPQYSFVQAMAALGCGVAKVADGIHPSAQIAAGTRLADRVSIGAGAIIEDGVEIGAGSVIGAGCIIERGASIGLHCHLHSRVTLAHSVQIGDRCILHSGVVIGADGFGLVMHEDRWHKIPQLGSVVIADDVEIGANTTVDRGALDNTVIEQGCKLDNQIQVAHNVRIGAHTAIAACVGIAGSTVIGRYCKISGGVGVVGHLAIADHVTITAMSLVTRDIREPGVYSSGTPLLANSKWRRISARYKALDKLALMVAKPGKSSPQG